MPQISEFKDGMTVDGIYLVKQAALRPTKKNTRFWAMQFRDKSGEIKAVCWDPHPEHAPAVGDAVRVSAVVEDYQGTLQLLVAKMSLIPKEDAPAASFLPSAVRPAEEMHAELVAKVTEAIDNEQLKAALLILLTEPGIKPALLKAPAASYYHHAYLGGLLEHILSLWGAASNIWVHYPWLKRDVLLAGCVLHDLAKVAEYSTEMALDYTPTGRLIGHVIVGSRMAWNTFLKCKVNHELILQILHVVASHHGEFAEIKPQTPEAIAFHYLDNLDAKLAGVKAILDTPPASTERFSDAPILKGKIYRAPTE